MILTHMYTAYGVLFYGTFMVAFEYPRQLSVSEGPSAARDFYGTLLVADFTGSRSHQDLLTYMCLTIYVFMWHRARVRARIDATTFVSAPCLRPQVASTVSMLMWAIECVAYALLLGPKLFD